MPRQRILKAMFVRKAEDFNRKNLFGNIYFDGLDFTDGTVRMYPKNIHGYLDCQVLCKVEDSSAFDTTVIQAPFPGVSQTEPPSLELSYFEEFEEPDIITVYDWEEAFVVIENPNVLMPVANDDFVVIPVKDLKIKEADPFFYEWLEYFPECALVFFR